MVFSAPHSLTENLFLLCFRLKMNVVQQPCPAGLPLIAVDEIGRSRKSVFDQAGKEFSVFIFQIQLFRIVLAIHLKPHAFRKLQDIVQMQAFCKVHIPRCHKQTDLQIL